VLISVRKLASCSSCFVEAVSVRSLRSVDFWFEKKT